MNDDIREGCGHPAAGDEEDDVSTQTDPDTDRGLYGKYRVERREDPTGKHDACSYFVLDLHHDEHARNALASYADSCESDYPLLAADLRRMLIGTTGIFRGEEDDVSTSMREELRQLVIWMDDDLDGEVADRYYEQPLAQDWARVAKAGEEAGEAIDALIGVTGQNPRKGEYGSYNDLLNELADVALTGLYAIQHFTKNGDETLDTLMRRARYHRERRAAQIAESAQV